MKGRLKLLLVEEDEGDFVFIKDLLLGVGSFEFDLDWAKTYESGLREIHRGEHDAILVAYRLGGRNGLELIREALAGGCLAPVILLTGHGGSRVESEAMEAGAADYLVKGRTDSDLLGRSIRYAISIKQSERELRNCRENLEGLVRERAEQSESLIADAHPALEKLQQSETLFRNLFEDHTAVKFIVDPDSGSIIDANEAAAGFYGWPRQRLRQMNIREINVLPPEEMRLALEKARTLNCVQFEFQHRMADGSIKDVEVFSGRIVVNGKELLHSIVHDITERKAVEASLRVTQFAVEHAADPIYWIGPDSKIIYANEAASRSLGYSREELLSMSVPDIDAIFKPEQWAARYEEHKRSGYVIFESEHRRKDGSTFPVEIRISNLKFNGAEFNFTFVKDITERKQAEQEILQAKRDWETTFDAMSDLIAILDVDCKIVRANKAMADRLGRTPEECVGLRCFEVMHGTDGPPESCPHKLSLSDRAEHTVEVFVESLGSYFTVGISPLFDPSGEFKGSVHVCRDIAERKQAENDLKRSESKYRQLFEVESDTLLLIDVDSLKIIDANSAAQKMYGYSREELLNMRVVEITTEPERTTTAIQGEVARIVERWHRKKDGTVFPVEITSTFFVLDGKRLHIGAVRDVSDRVQMEQSLRESEERWQFALEGPGDGVWDRDVPSNRAFYSTRWKTMLGYEEDEIGADLDEWRKRVHPDDKERCYAAMDCHIRGETPFYKSEHRLLCKDGSYKWILARGKVVEWADDGKPLRIIGTHTDITERKRAEEVLRNSEAQLRQIIDLMPHMIFVKDWNGKFLLANKADADAHNMSVGELTGKYHRDIHHNKSEVEQMLRDDREVITTGKMKFVAEEAHTDAQGNLRFLRTTKVPFRVLGEKTPAVLGVAMDITGEKRAKEEKEKLQTQLIQAQKMESVGRLAGGVAHDFNNMLGVILGYTDMALGKVDSINPLFVDLQEIRKAAMRSADLTRQLLGFARKQTVLPKVLDLNDKVEGMLKMLERVIGEDIELAWLPGGGVWPVKIDPTQIDQILVNLCVNARDAITDTGKVTIETRNVVCDGSYSGAGPFMGAGEYVVLSVSDNGYGMDKETADKIFEPFFTTKEVGKGTGLGLATVYGIVKQNEGFIDVYSEPGKGTTFTIHLPRHEGRSREEFDATSEKTAVGCGETVLLVEDEAVVLDMTTQMLERQGYCVLAASSPDMAIRLADEHKAEIRLLITDVIMPTMNGRDLAQKMLALVPNLKCLFMSGYTADVISREGVLADGVNFIEKPFSMREMAAKIRETLGQE